MKDFPFFTTESGLSSLILREVPYRQEAYIHIQDVQPEGFEAHLQECLSFCRMVGAQKIYARGHCALEGYPTASIYEMRGTAWVDPAQLAQVFPVTEKTVGQFRQLLNEKLRSVDHAATLTAAREPEILASSGACFVHDRGELLGLGWLEDTRLLVVAAVKPGAGERVMHSLMSLAEGQIITLEVAAANTRAIRFYERLGFLKTGEALRWHRVG